MYAATKILFKFDIRKKNKTMKTKLLFASAIVAVMFIANAFTTNGQDFYLKTPKGYTFIPSGSRMENGKAIAVQAFFIASTEITNGQYNAYLADLKKQNNTADYAIANCRNENWKSYQLPIAINYQLLKDYPVVNISKEAALLYCKWLTAKLENENKDLIFEVRLPTKAEWEWAALGGIGSSDYPWESSKYTDVSRFPAQYNNTLKQPTGPCNVMQYNENGYKLYGMAGNVAEIIGDADMVKGGSWNSGANELKIYSEELYQVSPTVGFRPIITFIAKNKQ